MVAYTAPPDTGLAGHIDNLESGPAVRTGEGPRHLKKALSTFLVTDVQYYCITVLSMQRAEDEPAFTWRLRASSYRTCTLVIATSSACWGPFVATISRPSIWRGAPA